MMVFAFADEAGGGLYNQMVRWRKIGSGQIYFIPHGRPIIDRAPSSRNKELWLKHGPQVMASAVAQVKRLWKNCWQKGNVSVFLYLPAHAFALPARPGR